MDASKKSKIALAGTTALVAEPFLAMLPHSNGVSVVASIIIGGAVYSIIEAVEEKTGRDLSLPVPKLQGTARQHGEHSLVYRLLNGKSTRGDLPTDDDLPTEEEIQAELERMTSVGVLNLGKTLRPHAESMLSKRIGMFGIPGSGKSNALAVFIEEIGKLDGKGVPFLYIDTEGEASGLLSPVYLARQYSANSRNVTLDNAKQFGRSILERGRQVIFDVQSYPSNDVVAAIIIDMIAGMWEWEEARENEDRVSCFVILDEAAVWLPQRQEMSALSRDATGKALFQKLQNTFFQSVVIRGRKRGLGFVFATQRPAELDNRAIVCNWFFLFKQTLPADLKVYRDIGVDEKAASNLQPGQAIIVDNAGSNSIHQFRLRNSPDNAKSPGLKSLSRYSNMSDDIYHEVNTEKLVNEVVNASVNGSTSDEKTPSDRGHLHLLSPDVNGVSEQEDASTGSVNVNAETRDIINRMAATGALTHAQISKIVRLDGRKYPIYKQVCLEEGIKIEKEA